MQKSGIMGGTGNNQFSPAGSYTREQSIATILRVYDLVNGETASGTHAGTRSDPLDASKGANVTYNDYSFYPTRQVSFKVLNTITGEGANYLAAKTSSVNDKPASGQEWLFFEVECSYVSSSAGSDDSFSPSSLFSSGNFFMPDGNAMSIASGASIYDSAFSEYNKEMYPGATSKILVGKLVDGGYGDVLLRIKSGSDAYTWLCLNAGGSTISTVDAVNSHFGLDEEGNHENDSIKITLKNTLPMDIANYSGNTRDAEANITDFSYTVSGSSVTITFSGQKTYDSKGIGQSRQFKVGWKLYDSEGYVIKDGAAYSTSIKVGEKFKNCEGSIYNLEPGEYTLEIMGVN